MISERRKLADIYRIEDGIIYYNYCERMVFSREVCPEIVDLLTKKRRVRIGREKKCRLMTVLYENEMRSINNYIAKMDIKFTLIPPYPKGTEIVRGVGSIEIKTKNKSI
jgi:hypothetical protein